MGCLEASVGFMVLTCVLSAVARKWAKSRFASGKNNTTWIYAEEAIATFELCAVCYELATVCDHFGPLYYGAGLFVAVLWWAMTWEEAKACPYFHFADMLTGKRACGDGLCRIAVETVSGLLVYPYVWLFWALGLSTEHREKAFDLRCVTDMQVSLSAAAVVECVGTLACVLFSLYINEKAAGKISAPLDALFSSTAVCLALNYTGGYYNPVLATSLKLGCDKDDYASHLVVYWLASSLGCIVACLLFESNLFRSRFLSTTGSDGYGASDVDGGKEKLS